MKLLALSDIHGTWNVSYMVEELLSYYEFDLILVAGDITNFGPPEFAEELLNSFKKPVLAVPGNCDPPGVLEAVDRSRAVNLHGHIYELGGYRFAGLGGTNGKGFTMGITFDEDYAYSLLRNCKDCIFLTHQPPLGILDRAGGSHIGCRGIRDAILESKPLLVVSGHVHEARGTERMGETLIVNPGPARDGYAALINLSDLSVEMLEK